MSANHQTIVAENSFVGPLFVLLGYFIFSTNGMWLILAPAGATPYTIAAFRMLIGSVLLILWLIAFKKKVVFSSFNWKSLLAYGLSTFLFQIAFYNSVLYAGLAAGTVVSVGSTPIFAGILQWLIFSKKPGKIWYPATLLGVLGVVLLNLDAFDGANLQSLLLPLLAGFFSAMCVLCGPSAVKGQDPIVAGTAACTVVAFLMLPFLFIYPVAWAFSAKGLLCVGMLGLANTAIGYLLIFKGFQTTTPAVAASVTLIEPVGAALIGIVFFNENSSLAALAGIALIVFSVGILVFDKKSE